MEICSVIIFSIYLYHYLSKTYDMPDTLLSAISEKSRLQNSVYNLSRFYFFKKCIYVYMN